MAALIRRMRERDEEDEMSEKTITEMQQRTIVEMIKLGVIRQPALDIQTNVFISKNIHKQTLRVHPPLTIHKVLDTRYQKEQRALCKSPLAPAIAAGKSINRYHNSTIDLADEQFSANTSTFFTAVTVNQKHTMIHKPLILHQQIQIELVANESEIVSVRKCEMISLETLEESSQMCVSNIEQPVTFNSNALSLVSSFVGRGQKRYKINFKKSFSISNLSTLEIDKNIKRRLSSSKSAFSFITNSNSSIVFSKSKTQLNILSSRENEYDIWHFNVQLSDIQFSSQLQLTEHQQNAICDLLSTSWPHQELPDSISLMNQISVIIFENCISFNSISFAYLFYPNLSSILCLWRLRILLANSMKKSKKRFKD